MIYAIDFDGTLMLQSGKFPNIGIPNVGLINFINRGQARGDKFILWTCRECEHLDIAIEWCKEQGVVFDAVNDNLQEIKDSMRHNSRKIFANYYVDDRNYRLLEYFLGPHVDDCRGDWWVERTSGRY